MWKNAVSPLHKQRVMDTILIVDRGAWTVPWFLCISMIDVAHEIISKLSSQVWSKVMDYIRP